MVTVEECLSSAKNAVLESQQLREGCQRSIRQAREQVDESKRVIAETRRLLESPGEPVESLQEISQIQAS